MDLGSVIQFVTSMIGGILGGVALGRLIFYTKQEIDELLDKKIKESVKDIKDLIAQERKDVTDTIKELQKTSEEIRESNKDVLIKMLETTKEIKEELRNDYTRNYNDLRLIVDKKADKEVADQLNQRLSWIGENIVTIKTALQLSGLLPSNTNTPPSNNEFPH